MKEVAIIGGGPAGSATALHLLQSGIKPVIFEKDSFPRYHIGESLTGEAGNSLRRLGLESFMTESAFPVKHGVNVYGPKGENAFWVPVARRDENNDLQTTTTWQVRRDEFDKKLLEVAVERGAELIQSQATSVIMDGEKVRGVRYRTPDGETGELLAKVVVDASGPATFLANSDAPTGKKSRGNYDKQVAIFSQVKGTVRDEGDARGNTLIFFQKKYHWAWFIPLSEDVVSVGVVVPGEYFKKQKLSKAEFLKKHLRELNPELARRVPDLDFVEEVRSVSNYSYHVKNYTGDGFLCVGDSHRFVDPIFSFGVNFAMREAQLAAPAIVSYLSGETKGNGNPFADYELRSERGQDVIQDLVDVFWDHSLPFVVMVHHKHRDEMIDLFAGRIFDDDVDEKEAVIAMRKILTQKKAA